MRPEEIKDIALPGDDPAAGALLREDGSLDDRHVPQDPSWAGLGFGGRGPLHCQPFTTWRCLECPQGWDSNARSAREDSQEHARRARHIVQSISVTTWIPTERK